MMKRYFLIILSSCLLFVALSCKDDSLDPNTSSVEGNFAAWEALGISDYNIIQRQLCFCIDGGVVAIVNVRDNKIVSVTDSVSNNLIPQERWQYFKTIDQLFETALKAQQSKPARFEITYNNTYRFPAYVWVDENFYIADEEYGYLTTSFQSLK